MIKKTPIKIGKMNEVCFLYKQGEAPGVRRMKRGGHKTGFIKKTVVPYPGVSCMLSSLP